MTCFVAEKSTSNLQVIVSNREQDRIATFTGREMK